MTKKEFRRLRSIYLTMNDTKKHGQIWSAF